MKFDNSFIDQVRNSISIVDLIGGYIHLKKKGKDFAALCPFHQEKTPSFLVSESKRIFKCFGCGVGGDAFKFITLIENIAFPEAIEYLAERYGITLPTLSEKTESRNRERQRLLEVMEFTTRFFSACLKENKEALEYLSNRQIDSETIDEFMIGFAPSGQSLSSALKDRGYRVEELVQCGLVVEKDSGSNYERFRNRVVFPIRNLSGKTIAFGGRILGEGVPKYLNSPETELYKKGYNLFGLDVTRDEIRRRDFAILVEGYFDCVVPFQFGIRNVVASLGTSLTENQVKLLGRYTRNVIINFDPDSAGLAASIRSIDLFLEQGFRVNVLQLPKGEDPDTFVRKEGKSAYWDNLKTSLPYLDFVLSKFMSEHKDPSSPKAKQEIVSQILPYMVKVPNRIERAEYFTRLASRLDVDENLIVAEVRRMAQAGTREGSRLPSPIEQTTPAERTLLRAILDPHWSKMTIAQLDSALFEDLRTMQIFTGILQLQEEDRDVTAVGLLSVLSEEADRDFVEALALDSTELPLSEEVIKSSIQALRKKQFERLSRQIQADIQKAEKEDTPSDRIDELLLKKEQIRKKI